MPHCQDVRIAASAAELRRKCDALKSHRPNSGTHQGGHAIIRFLEGFLEGSLKEVLLRSQGSSVVKTRFLEGFLEGSVS